MHHGIYIFGAAGTPLDFERRNSRLDELVDERQGAEILRGENRVRRDLELGVRIVDRVSVLILRIPGVGQFLGFCCR